MNLSSLFKRGAAATAIVLAASPIVATASFAASAPATPGSVALTSANRALGVSWTESSTGAITFVATAKAAGHATHSCTTHALKCSVTSLVNGVVYSVTVVAKNATGSSVASSPVTMKVGVPSAPLSVHVYTGKGTAHVSWAPPIASGVAAVTSYTATAMPGSFTCTTTATATVPAARHCVISGLTKGTKYTVSVTATNAVGTSNASKSASVIAG